MHSAHRWLRTLGILGVSVVSLLLVVVLALQVPFIATWAARRLATLVPLNSGYRLEPGRARGDWLTALRLQDVRLLHGERILADIDQLCMSYNLPRLLGAKTLIRSLTVKGGRVIARREGGSWDIAQAFGGETTPPLAVAHLSYGISTGGSSRWRPARPRF